MRKTSYTRVLRTLQRARARRVVMLHRIDCRTAFELCAGGNRITEIERCNSECVVRLQQQRWILVSLCDDKELRPQFARFVQLTFENLGRDDPPHCAKQLCRPAKLLRQI